MWWPVIGWVKPDGPTCKAAVKKFAKVMLVGEAAKAEDDNLVITVLDRSTVHLTNQQRLKTLDILLCCTKSAVEDFGPPSGAAPRRTAGRPGKAYWRAPLSSP